MYTAGRPESESITLCAFLDDSETRIAHHHCLSRTLSFILS